MEYFIGENIPKAINQWKQALRYDPEYKNAADDMAHTEMLYEAIDLYKKDRFSEARYKADNTLYYELTSNSAAKLIDKMNGNAEEHFKKGVKHFLHENLLAAITEWDITLALNPQHKEAEKSIQKSRDLLKKLKAIK